MTFVEELHSKGGLKTVYKNAFLRSGIETKEQIQKFILSKNNPHIRDIGLSGFVHIRQVYENYTNETADGQKRLGRPKKPPEEVKSKAYRVRLTEEQYNHLKFLAYQERKSVSQLIRTTFDL